MTLNERPEGSRPFPGTDRSRPGYPGRRRTLLRWIAASAPAAAPSAAAASSAAAAAPSASAAATTTTATSTSSAATATATATSASSAATGSAAAAATAVATALLLSFIPIAVRPVAAQEPPQPFLEEIRWVSEADDISGLLVNPAGLAFRTGREGLLEVNFDRGERSEGVALLGFSFLKLGYIHDNVGTRDYDTYALGTGIDLAPLSFGWTTRLHRSDTGNGSKATAHDVGALFRPLRYVSTGFRLRNLNEPAFSGGVLPRGYTGAISVRPLLADPERFTATLQTEWRRSNDRVRYTVAGEYRIRDGLRLAAHWTSRVRRAGLALSIDFPSQTVRTAATDAEGGGVSPRTGYALHSHSDFRRKVFPVVKGFAEVRVDGTYEDQASGFVLAGASTRSGPRLIQVLKRVREDQDIAGAVVTIGKLGGGFLGDVTAIHQEIRAGILDIRAAGKPVVAYLEEGGGAAEIYIASAADRIVMPRLASFSGIGVAVEILRLKSAFADFGIDWDARTAGEYKSTFHTYYTDSTTAAQREEVESLVEASFAELERTLVEARHLSPDARQKILSGGIVSASEARDFGLIDEIGWYDDARRAASRLSSRAPGAELLGSGATPADMGAAPDTGALSGAGGAPAGSGRSDPARLKRLENRRYWKDRWTPPPAVGVILAGGAIASGEGGVNRLFGGRTMGAETVARAIRAAAANPSVRALVLRVDTGGGSALASDRIRREILEARKRRGFPIIVSMGNTAASGGYWISMDGDSILANPLTVTGSIGVVNAKPVLARLLEKREINREVFKKGEYTDMFSATRPMSEAERQQVGQEIDAIYDSFLDGVAEGRHMPRADVERVAGGRVWLGSQAVENGLVDRLGTLDDAVRLAADAAGIASDHRILWYTGKRPGFLARIAQGVEYVAVSGAELWTGNGAEAAESP